MLIFIANLQSSLGEEIAKVCQGAGIEVAGAVATRNQRTLAKQRLQPRVPTPPPVEEENEENAEPPEPTEPVEPPPMPPTVTIILQNEKTAVEKLLRQSDVIIASIFDDDKFAMQCLQTLETISDAKEKTEEDEEGEEEVLENQESAEEPAQRKFIAISSVLAWSKNMPMSKRIDAETGATLGHREEGFKTRKAAKRFAELKQNETQVLGATRSEVLETYVVAAGLLYGGRESPFNYLFRSAWMYPDQPLLIPTLGINNTPARPANYELPSGGNNLLPTIGLVDAAFMIFKLATCDTQFEKRYLLAIDSCPTTLRDVCEGVSILLGNGKLRELTNDPDAAQLEEELLLLKNEIIPLQLNLSFDMSSAALKELVSEEEWQYLGSGLLRNLGTFVQEFVKLFDVRPLKVIVLGPPQVGKTTWSHRLSAEYYLPYITVESVVNEFRQQEASGEDLLSVSDKTKEEALNWQAGTELEEATVIELLRWKMCSPICRNHGYVTDGLPLNKAQAEQIYAIEEEEEAEPTNDEADTEGDQAPPDEQGEDQGVDEVDGSPENEDATLTSNPSKAYLSTLKANREIQLPNRVIILDAPKAVLDPASQKPVEGEEPVVNAEFEAKYEQYASVHEELVTYLETAHQGVETLELSLSESDAVSASASVWTEPIKRYLEQGGKPCNFHPTPQEIERNIREAEEKQRKEEEEALRLEREQKEKEERELADKQLQDKLRMEAMQREEAELLERRAKPLRAYLSDSVLTSLTEGLLEVAKMRPEDPVDYLADFLFRKGREGSI